MDWDVAVLCIESDVFLLTWDSYYPCMAGIEGESMDRDVRLWLLRLGRWYKEQGKVWY